MSEGARVSPDELRDFGSRVHNVSTAITEVQQALDGLAGARMATGSGPDNAEIVQYYRDLIGGEAAPAARRLAATLEQIRDTAHATADEWENQEFANRAAFQG